MTIDAHEAGLQLAAYLKRAKKQQKELAAELGIEASYVSRMVKGHINWTTSRYFGKIASSLRLEDHEVKYLNPAAVVEYLMPQDEISEMVPIGEDDDDTTSLDIPTALIEAAEMYKGIDPRIADPSVQQALARAGYFGGGPETPQEWIRYFNDVRDWLGRGSN
jgi:transcriptional regulator with XRE-family HTH domain